MDKNVKIGIGAVVLLVVASLFLGGSKDKNKVENTISDLVINTEEFTIADWPNLIPIYNENVSEEKIDKTVDGDGKENWRATILAADDEVTIFAWYKEALETKGFSVSSKRVGPYEIVEARKDNLYTTFQVHYDSEKELSSISQNASIRALETEDEEISEEETEGVNSSEVEADIELVE